MTTEPQPWSIEDAKEVYNIEHWSDGFFDIDNSGSLVAYPHGEAVRGSVNLTALAQDIVKAGLTFPVLVRFTDILKRRFDHLHTVFSQTIRDAEYQGQFTAVYPIKVNQQRHVAMEIVRHGQNKIGLEAGSKPELLAVLGLTQEPDALVICNGYKDREYIRLALIGQQLGKRVYIILEKMSELDLILEEAAKLDVQPCLGLRIRLATMGAGKWQNTAGEKAKFGFSASQILYIIERLRQHNMLASLQILHFHLGSQIANISDIQRGLRECARYYSELRALGANIHTIDVGGGLGVDYEGTHTRSFCSMNYSMQEYANNIVYTLLDICNENQLPHPHIITESGRAMTAHHALIITNIIGRESYQEELSGVIKQESDTAQILKDLWYGYENLSRRNAVETYHDVKHYIHESHNMFTYGLLDLAERARAEQIYLALCFRIRDLLNPSVRAHREIIDELNERLADKYFMNLSIFQSMPDAWAIDQVFPILPIAGLQKAPSVRAVLQDLTCDSDGRIDVYVDGQEVESTLPLLSIDEHEKDDYLLGIFLVGAYQEILGDMHNLFGDTDSIHVELLDNGEYQLVQPEEGDTVADVLHYVHYDTEKLLQSYQQQLNKTSLSKQQVAEYYHDLSEGLLGYTYLETDKSD